MQIVFVHQYFPGQFARLARHFVSAGHEVVALYHGHADGRSSEPVEGVRTISYGDDLPPSTEDNGVSKTTQFLREAASAALRAQELRETGWRPDLIYSHTGWGGAAFLHDVFPTAKFVKYCEWYYNNRAGSTEFFHPGGRPLLQRLATSAMNLPILADLAQGHALVSPTEWQRSQFPRAVRDKITVIPDGIDLDLFTPTPDASFELPDGRRIGRSDRVVTYAARGADPFRGFAQFLEALARLQARDPNLEAVVLGDRKVYYGPGVGTEAYFDKVLANVRFDRARTHFLGKVPYETYLNLLQVSSAHVYLTAPFVLSWSCLEAMAAGCAVIGSDTAPVREFITHGENGLLANFFDPAEIAQQIEQALKGGPEIEQMREGARRTIEERWSADRALRQQVALAEELLKQPR